MVKYSNREHVKYFKKITWGVRMILDIDKETWISLSMLGQHLDFISGLSYTWVIFVNKFYAFPKLKTNESLL